MNQYDINPKFFKFLTTAKDLAITEGVKKKIEDALDIANSDEINEIKTIIKNPKAEKDEYEYAYNYLDKEFNIFKFAKKDPLRASDARYRKPDDEIKPWIKNVKEGVTILATIASMVVMVIGGMAGLKGGSSK